MALGQASDKFPILFTIRFRNDTSRLSRFTFALYQTFVKTSSHGFIAANFASSTAESTNERIFHFSSRWQLPSKHCFPDGRRRSEIFTNFHTFRTRANCQFLPGQLNQGLENRKQCPVPVRKFKKYRINKRQKRKVHPHNTFSPLAVQLAQVLPYKALDTPPTTGLLHSRCTQHQYVVAIITEKSRVTAHQNTSNIDAAQH